MRVQSRCPCRWPRSSKVKAKRSPHLCQLHSVPPCLPSTRPLDTRKLRCEDGSCDGLFLFFCFLEGRSWVSSARGWRLGDFPVSTVEFVLVAWSTSLNIELSLETTAPPPNLPRARWRKGRWYLPVDCCAASAVGNFLPKGGEIGPLNPKGVSWADGASQGATSSSPSPFLRSS